VAYELEFHPAALKEWQILDNSVRMAIFSIVTKSKMTRPGIDWCTK
jgi:mRNA-degrading endonuclease RelE of RelBE toxin-antitoxin system